MDPMLRSSYKKKIYVLSMMAFIFFLVGIYTFTVGANGRMSGFVAALLVTAMNVSVWVIMFRTIRGHVKEEPLTLQMETPDALQRERIIGMYESILGKVSQRRKTVNRVAFLSLGGMGGMAFLVILLEHSLFKGLGLLIFSAVSLGSLILFSYRQFRKASEVLDLARKGVFQLARVKIADIYVEGDEDMQTDPTFFVKVTDQQGCSRSIQVISRVYMAASSKVLEDGFLISFYGERGFYGEYDFYMDMEDDFSISPENQFFFK